MKRKNLDEVVKLLAKQNPARVRRSVARARALLAGAGPASGAATSTFPPIIEGPPPKVAVKFRIRFSPDKQHPPLAGKKESWTPAESKAGALLGGFSEDELRQLRSIEPVLLQWMAADKEHAARFFADPMGALETAGVKLDPKLLRKIKQQRSRSLANLAQLPHAHIDSIDVDVDK